MKRTILILAIGLALAGPAHAGTLAGALDGRYQAADGGYVELSSPEDRFSIEGRNCGNPVVRGGRLVSKDCWGNGHQDADLEITWRVKGDVILSEGKRYIRLPAKPAVDAATESNVTPRPAVALVDPTGRPWRHNGSIVMADPGTGIIAYVDPKASLKPAVQEGTVLFRGELRDHKPIRGTAYAYKTGCPAAPYPVRGAYSGPDTLTLRGAGPVRRGCEVIGYSDRSPHAVLRFTYLLDD